MGRNLIIIQKNFQFILIDIDVIPIPKKNVNILEIVDQGCT